MFFVMLSLSNGNPMPMIDENGDPAMFASREDAQKAAENNPLGQAYRFEIYEW